MNKQHIGSIFDDFLRQEGLLADCKARALKRVAAWRLKQNGAKLLARRIETKRLHCSPMNDQIVIDPRICHGKPVIRGTRMPVSLIVGSLAGGMTFEEVEKEYGVTQMGIRAALKFAGELVDQEEHHPLAPAAK